MSERLSAFYVDRLREHGLHEEADYFEEHCKALVERKDFFINDARLARTERDQWMNRCLDLQRQYGVRRAEKPREHNEAVTYAYEGDGSTP